MCKNLILTLFAAISVMLLTSQSFAVVVGGHDFDGGLTATSFTTFPVDPGLNGLLGTVAVPHNERFDRWGVANRVVPDSGGLELSLPFDVQDDSADPNSVAAEIDVWGILKLAETDNKFHVTDLENGVNPSGTGVATWTFDITGMSNLQLSIDMAAQGNFNSGDTFDFVATIDNVPASTQLLFDVGNVSGELYTTTNEFGNTFDRYNNIFWDPSEDLTWAWVLDPNAHGPLPQVSPFSGLLTDWSAFDADMDGFDDSSGEKAFQEFVVCCGGFFAEVAEAYQWRGPLGVVLPGGDPNNPTRLDNDFQTLTAPITGTGTELTITMSAAQSGSFEFYVFDNLLVEGDSAANADFDGSGFVDGLDFLKWQRGETPGGGSQAELALWEIQYGGPPPLVAGIGAVPEPTSLALFGLGLVLAPLAVRRRVRNLA